MTSRLLGFVLTPLLLALCGCPKNPGAVNPNANPGAAPADAQPTIEVQHDPAARAALDQAVRTEPTVTPQVAIQSYLAVRSKWPSTAAGEEALYRAAVLSFQSGDYPNAKKRFDALLLENPLYPQAVSARVMLGKTQLQLGQDRDAYQTLSSVAEAVPADQRAAVLAAAEQAAEGAGLSGDALALLVNRTAEATTPEQVSDLVKQVETLVDGQASFSEVAQVASGTSPSNPAWPALTFKLARIYYHLRDWPHLTETLQSITEDAPQSPYATQAQALLARINRREVVHPKVVGVLLPMSGKFQPFGEAVMRGMKLGFQGSDLQVVVKDTKGDLTATGASVESLVFDDGAIAAIGPLLTESARRAAVVSQELRLPLLTLTRAEEVTDIGDYVFRDMLTDSAQAKALASWATQVMHFQKFGLLYPDIPYGNELADDFWDAVVADGGEIRGAQHYQSDQTTFTGDVERLVGRYDLSNRPEYEAAVKKIQASKMGSYRKHKAMEKARDELDPIIDFDALFIPDDWRRVGLVAPALAVQDIITNACDPRDLKRIEKTTGKKHLHTVTLLGANQWSSPKGPDGVPQLLTRGGKFVDCAVWVDGFWPDSARPATRQFVDAYRKAYDGKDPGLLEAIGYDTARMVRELLDQKQPATRDAFRDALEQVKDFPGATGTTHFNAQREAVKPLFFLRIDKGKVVEISPDHRLAGS